MSQQKQQQQQQQQPWWFDGILSFQEIFPFELKSAFLSLLHIGPPQLHPVYLTECHRPFYKLIK